jgi:hypothetical protein
VQPQPSSGQALADDGHAQVRPVGAAEGGREGPAQEAGGIRSPAHLAQQRVPLGAGDATVLDVGAGELPPVVEEADVVVLLLERLDLGLDEVVDSRQQLGDLYRDLEVHGVILARALN